MGEARLLVFGDIHGAVGALRRLLARVDPRADDTLIFLGDYIDRGEDSRAVLDTLIELERAHLCVFLKGNHEDMFLTACDGGLSDWSLWLQNGGMTTLRDFDQALPPERYMDWLLRLRLHFETETHYFVHAGLRPGAPPDATSDHERLWIREPFLSSAYDWGKRVIFGHTVQFGEPLVQPNKIGIDTGAFVPGIGKLTCLLIPEMRFIFSRGRSRQVP